MKKTILTLLIFSLNFINLYALEADDFIYDGIEMVHPVYLSSIERLPNGQYQQIKTEARLIFDSKTKELGKNLKIEVHMNGVDVGMTAFNQTNTLALLKLRKSDRWFTENTINVLMEIDVKFSENLNLQSAPYINPMSDLLVSDDFVSFTTGKITSPETLTSLISIYKKKAIGKDQLVFEGTFNVPEMVVTDFGGDRSLVTVDLNKIITNLERDKTHVVKVTVMPHFNKWRAFNENSKELFKTPEPIKIETKFRY